MWRWEVATEAVVWSDQGKALFGFSPTAPITYTLFLQAIHPDDRQRVDEALGQALELRTMLRVELRTFGPNRMERRVGLIGRGFYDESGKPLRMAGVAFEVTGAGAPTGTT